MLIKLLNMPFGALTAPSIALTQLQGVVRQMFGGGVKVDIHYVNIDFAKHLGSVELYGYPLSPMGFMTGIGDMFFRKAAFPDAPDNLDEYLSRFYYEEGPHAGRIREFMREEGAETSVFIDRIIRKYSLLNADLVGCTALFAQTTASIAILRRIKELAPETVTAIGGPCMEGVPGQEFAGQVGCLDFVFSGSSLKSFPQVVDNILQEREAECHAVNGVFSKHNSAAWQVPGVRGGLVKIVGDETDINENIEMDYGPFLDAFEQAFPGDDMSPILFFETSRGCWWGAKKPCSFCGLNGLRKCYRAKTPERAAACIESMFGYYPRSRCFVAVDTIMPRNYVREVFPKIDPPGDATIKYEMRPDLDEKDIATLCRAGVRAVQPGIESLSTRSLQLMRKGLSAFTNISFLKAGAMHPLTIEWNLLVFPPGEPDAAYDKYEQTMPLLTHLPPPIAAYPIMFTRHSVYVERPEQYGLRLRPQDFYRLTYPFGDESVGRMAFHFVNDNEDVDHINDRLDRLNATIRYWRQRWSNADNLKPAMLFWEPDCSEPTVYDSRNGSVSKHRPGELSRKILDFLDGPRSPGNIKQKFRSISASDIDRELNSLSSKGLVFEEDGCFMSLVLNGPGVRCRGPEADEGRVILSERKVTSHCRNNEGGSV